LLLHAIRRRLAGDEGLTIVEMIVALVVLTITLLGLATSLIAGLQAQVANEARTRANALANETLENLQAEDWFTIIAPLPEPSDPDDLVISTETVTRTRQFVDYEVTSHIAWVNDPATADLGDYLQFTVTVEWTARDRTRSVTHAALRSPPAELPPAAVAVRSLRADPELGRLKQAGDSDNGKVDYRVVFDENGTPSYESVSGVDLTLVTTLPLPPGATVTVKFLPRDQWPDGALSGPHSLVNPSGDNQTWTISSGGSWRFPNGDTTFEFTITAGDVTLEVSKIIHYVHELIDVDEPPPAQTVQLDCAGRGIAAVELDAHFQGLSSLDEVEVTGAGLPVDPPDVATFDTRTRTGGWVHYTIPAGHTYGASTEVTMTAVRWFDPVVSASTTATLSLQSPDPEDCDGD
jgi:type II secretory pathway pseudopilin PulG